MRTLKRRLRGEGGFTMVTILGVLLVTSAFAITAFTAANNDIQPSASDVYAKQAYEAAEAGVNWYEWELNHDNAFWTYCTGGVPTPPPTLNPTPANWPVYLQGANRTWWQPVQGTNASWAIEEMLQNGATSCDGTGASMIDATSGVLQIRSTGISNGVKRSIIATFKRASFLNYIYFTNREDEDPSLYGADSTCTNIRAQRDSTCQEIEFINGDTVAGPMHTNDSFFICGSPTFGGSSSDKIEIVGTPPWTQNGSCGPSTQGPNYVGTPVLSTTTPAAANLPIPTTNSPLSTLAQQNGYYFKGTTQLTINGNSISATDGSGKTLQTDQNGRPLPGWPANGVVYVDTNTSPSPPACSYSEQEQYTNSTRCGDAYVKTGVTPYQSSLTIASANDIIANGPIRRDTTKNVVLGLIPQNFARVYHPGTFSNGTCTGNAASTPNFGPSLGTSGVEIDAALLALSHSFIVDNFGCGTQLGTLTVNGAIAEAFRGPVGQSYSGGWHGYVKNYSYDSRLRNVNPPYFLDPAQSAWHLDRFTEQLPPT